jgi:tetratricopeptide (TPR) repeat protein
MAASAETNSPSQLPYVGARPFSASDSREFFGRSAESAAVAELWRDQQVTVVTGQSGVGVTSLLQAGVIPLVDPATAEVLPAGRIRGGTCFPVAALADYNPYKFALLATWSPSELGTRISGMSVRDFLRRRARRFDSRGRPLPVLAIIDQAEDLITSSPYGTSHREQFVEELTEALDELPMLHLLIGVRQDYLEELVACLRFFQSARAPVTLGPLSLESAATAVTAPLAGTGRSFAPGVAENLVTRVGTNRAFVPAGQSAGAETQIEPALLQVVCAELWRALPGNVRLITSWHLEVFGDLDRVLAAYIGHVMTMVADCHGIGAAELGSWVRQTFVTERGTRATAREGPVRTAGMPNAALRALRDSYVLSGYRPADTRWYELRHDRLIEPVIQSSVQLAARERVPSLLSQADRMRAAEAAMAVGDLGLTVKHADALLADLGKDLRMSAKAESLLGNVEYCGQHYPEAEVHYRAAAALEEVLQDSPAVVRLLAAVGQAQLAQGRRGEAVNTLHSAVGRNPGDLVVQTELAWALWHAGLREAAVAVLTGVLAVDGTAPDALRARGEILADLGDAEGALRDLDRLRRRQRPSTQAARALALATIRKLSAADPEIHAALSYAPDSGPVLLYAARVAALSDAPATAANLAQRAMAATDPAVPPHQREQARQLIDRVS